MRKVSYCKTLFLIGVAKSLYSGEFRRFHIVKVGVGRVPGRMVSDLSRTVGGDFRAFPGFATGINDLLNQGYT